MGGIRSTFVATEWDRDCALCRLAIGDHFHQTDRGGASSTSSQPDVADPSFAFQILDATFSRSHQGFHERAMRRGLDGFWKTRPSPNMKAKEGAKKAPPRLQGEDFLIDKRYLLMEADKAERRRAQGAARPSGRQAKQCPTDPVGRN